MGCSFLHPILFNILINSTMKISLVIGEWGARLPRHNKPSGKLLTPTIAEAKLMVTAFTSHLEKRGINDGYCWMYDNSFYLNSKGMPASFYTPVELFIVNNKSTHDLFKVNKSFSKMD